MRRGRMHHTARAAAAVGFVLAVCLGVEAAEGPRTTGSETNGHGADRVGAAARDLKLTLGRELELLEQDACFAERAARAASELYADGAATRGEVGRAERALGDLRARIDETRRRIDEVEVVIAEAAEIDRVATPAVDVAKVRVIRGVTRDSGASGWTLAGISRVRAFYVVRFGRALPVSAFGQTAVHDRLGFDHRNAFDVAVRPDSPEGQALLAYLRAEKIPFIAFSGAVPGKSTGAHIHVGYPSRRR